MTQGSGLLLAARDLQRLLRYEGVLMGSLAALPVDLVQVTCAFKYVES